MHRQKQAYKIKFRRAKELAETFESALYINSEASFEEIFIALNLFSLLICNRPRHVPKAPVLPTIRLFKSISTPDSGLPLWLITAISKLRSISTLLCKLQMTIQLNPIRIEIETIRIATKERFILV